MMDDGRQHETGRHKVDYYRASHAPWNMMNQHHHHQAKEPNALVMNKKIMSIIAERDAAIRERNAAISEKKEALAERDEALRQRDAALAERDNAIAASLQIRNPSTKRVTTAFPMTAISSGEAAKSSQRANSSNKRKRVPSDGTKYKTEWGRGEQVEPIAFDEGSMPVPVCSCTGAARQCYKWGSGGWQSSCCTTHMSVYPLPQVPNKRHARMGGRKMSGSVFTRLLTRLALQGHDLSLPLDLKEYWARHGTNRYITIK